MAAKTDSKRSNKAEDTTTDIVIIGAGGAGLTAAIEATMEGAKVIVVEKNSFMGGIKINTNAQVINNSGNVVEGLYVAGEVTGGVYGGNRIGGNAVADITIFGRIAGKSAAAFVK